MDDSLGPPKGISMSPKAIIFILYCTYLSPIYFINVATVKAMIKELAEGTKFGDNYSELVMEIS